MISVSGFAVLSDPCEVSLGDARLTVLNRAERFASAEESVQPDFNLGDTKSDRKEFMEGIKQN